MPENVGWPLNGAGRCLLEPKWWSASAAGVPNCQNDQLVVERRVVDVVTTTRQEDPSRASDGRSSIGCATTHRSPERDRRLQEWFGRSGSPLAPKLADDRGGGTTFACLRGRPRSRERLVQGLTFVLRQIVPLIVDDQVKLRALGQPCWLVEAQPPVLDTCTQRSHVITVRRQEAYRQAGSRAVQNNAAGPRSMKLWRR